MREYVFERFDIFALELKPNLLVDVPQFGFYLIHGKVEALCELLNSEADSFGS